jgi:hypothetical protein
MGQFPWFYGAIPTFGGFYQTSLVKPICPWTGVGGNVWHLIPFRQVMLPGSLPIFLPHNLAVALEHPTNGKRASPQEFLDGGNRVEARSAAALRGRICLEAWYASRVEPVAKGLARRDWIEEERKLGFD